MTVQELMDKLKTLPPDLEVVDHNYHGIDKVGIHVFKRDFRQYKYSDKLVVLRWE